MIDASITIVAGEVSGRDSAQASYAEVIDTKYTVRTAQDGLMDWWIVALIVVAIFSVDAAYRHWLNSGQR
jgi:hypothetical protein